MWPSDEEDAAAVEPIPTRIVEIGRTPASSVPLLAALEGVDLGDLELAEGHRALLAELPAEKEGWNFGDLPLVTLSVTDGEFQVFLVTDDHLEHIISHNWGMDAAIVPGGHDRTAELPLSLIHICPSICGEEGNHSSWARIERSFSSPATTLGSRSWPIIMPSMRVQSWAMSLPSYPW